MISLIMIFAVLLIFPSLMKDQDRKYRIRKEREWFQRTIREESKRGNRWH